LVFLTTFAIFGAIDMIRQIEKLPDTINEVKENEKTKNKKPRKVG
jgi:hypothetical protein